MHVHDVCKNRGFAKVQESHCEEEVGWLRQAVLPGKHVVDVPGNHSVEHTVDEHHEHGEEKAPLLVDRRRLVEVGPSQSDP